MSKTGRVRKADEKDRVICLFFIFLPGLRSFNCQIMCCFLQFCADISKKSKSDIVMYSMHLKALITVFQKMVLFVTQGPSCKKT